ncbi:MAG: NirA family protein [Fibrobacteres bacterium]|nr:NirA family protein [Fibrobacterota bacterium]MBK9575812.1 NirA family protein [Fibrobacterota bacterium]QQS04885.1 MAG: NirA family protein [Fibrobacterota bacterium]
MATNLSNPDGSAFSTDQKEWLDGFLKSAMHLTGNVGDGEANPYPVEASAGYRAQTRWVAEGKRLSKEEEIKRRRNPHLFRSRLAELDAQGCFPEGEENFLSRFHGIFNVAPAQDRPMARFRIPAGIVNFLQARVIAKIGRDLSDGVVWLTTRANVQVRNLQPGKMTELLVRLEECGLGARGSGADNVRNVVGNPTAGIDPRELLDVRGLCRTWHHHLLHSPDLHGLPRKFNVAFDGGNSVAALEDTNDIGLRACRLEGDAQHPSGTYLRLALGGITGHKDFARDTGVVLGLEEWLPALDAMLRVFLENGNRGQRGKARLKYLLDDWGFEQFLAVVQERLAFPLRRVPLAGCTFGPAADRSAHLGVHPQRQDGLCWVGVHVPVGRLSADQLEGIADIARRHGDGDLRLTVWQNLLISGLRKESVAEVEVELAALGLSSRPDGIRQGLVACTGSEGCKHGQAATKATALAIETLMSGKVPADLPVNIHLTGCAHSCAQHFMADIGLLGTGLEVDGARKDAFHVLVGGGSAPIPRCAVQILTAVPAERIPQVVEGIVGVWQSRRKDRETFADFAGRHGPEEIKSLFAGIAG